MSAAALTDPGRAEGRLAVAERRLPALRRAEADALANYRAACAALGGRGDDRPVVEAERVLALARRDVARAEAAADHWRGLLAARAS